MHFDISINHVTVIDGTGVPRYRACLGLQGGRIAAIARDGVDGDGRSLPAARQIDAAGLAAAPGFIDIHSHADWILPLPEHAAILAPLVLQGITTVVAGNCGSSPAPALPGKGKIIDATGDILRLRPLSYTWSSFAEFCSALQGRSLLNAAFLAGHGTLRAQVMGWTPEVPTSAQMDEMRRLTRQALREGAFGLSAGLAYTPGVFARNDELLALLEVVKEEEGLFAVHGRAYTWVSPFYTPMFFGPPHNLRSVRELLGLARQAGVRLQLSHQIFVGRHTWRTHTRVLAEIERAAGEGQDVAFDAYPYHWGNSTVKVIFPKWFLDGYQHNVNDPIQLRRLKREIQLLKLALGIDYRHLRLLWADHPVLDAYNGLDFAEIAVQMKLPPFEAYLHVARETNGKALLLLGAYSGDDTLDPPHDLPLQRALTHPLCAFMTDTILTGQGVPNPASYGTFPRILGRYSRDLGLFSLEEAVRRMTSLPAERMGFHGMGKIAEGFWADLVLFNPQTIADNTTPACPDRPPSGIQAVLISGQIAAENGSLVEGVHAGRILSR